MSIKSSKYTRQGALTFNIRRLSGGSYGCDIDYDYGVFEGECFTGMTYHHHKYTEFESDDDEKDGIGSMTTVRDRSLWIGEFKSGKPHGFCYELGNGYPGNARKFGIYESGELVSTDTLIEKAKASEGGIYRVGHNALIFEGEKLVYVGNVNKDGVPSGLGVRYDTNGDVVEYGNFENGKFNGAAFEFNSWEKMPAAPVESDGFSVFTEMTFFNDGDVRSTVTEGEFANGSLNGLGMISYDSNVNGYHSYSTKAGVFKNGELLFGYKHFYENTGGKKPPASFGYADGRDIEKYGSEMLYNGKKYIGEAVGGVPHGIGCMYESDEKMYKGTFKDGKYHGIGATYKLIDGEWTPYDFAGNIPTTAYSYNSWGIFAEGELCPDMTLEEFFDKYEQLKKV
ncbi:MAG: hypothetical protein E7589_05980 [Ruminococcaceae bacterium]|nr:hypothetical protein [Oscillospiraceae bacterium]